MSEMPTAIPHPISPPKIHPKNQITSLIRSQRRGMISRSRKIEMSILKISHIAPNLRLFLWESFKRVTIFYKCRRRAIISG